METQTKRSSYYELQEGEATIEEEDEEEDIGKHDELLQKRMGAEAVASEAEADTDDEATAHPMAIKFTYFRECVLYVLVLFYLADIALDMWVAVRLFRSKHSKTGWFVVFCILVPNLYAGYKSLQWYLKSHDLEPVNRPLPWILRIIFFPLSLLLRYFDTWKYGYGSRDARRKHDRKNEVRLFSLYLIESAEVSMLRLFIIFLEDAPIAVLNVRGFIVTPPDVQKHHLEMVLVVMFKLTFTMTLGVVHFIISTKAVYHAAKSERNSMMGSQWTQQMHPKRDWQKKGFLSGPAQITIYLWHFCAIGSRLVTYAMFITMHQRFIWLLVALRWLVNTVWIKVDACEISLTNCIAFGGVYLFSFVPTSTKDQFARILVYYGLTFLEAIIVALLFSASLPNDAYSEGAFAVVFGGAIISMMFMCLYYGAFHPSRAQTKIHQWYRNRRNNRSSAAA